MSDSEIPTTPAYERLRTELREAELFSSAAAVLSWDQETLLPPRGTALRAEQIALLSGAAHERRTAPALLDALSECEADPALTADARVAANLRELRRDVDRLSRLPSSLVREVAETTTLAQQAWRDARERSDYGSFAPWLERVVRLSRAKAECYGATTATELYDQLMEDYEPGMRSAEVERVFSALRPRLVPLIREVAAAGSRPESRFHRTAIPIPQQQAFNPNPARAVG